MSKENYNYVDYMCYEAKLDKQVSVCRIQLIEGKLVYEGHEAEQTKKMVEEHPLLVPFRKVGGYPLLVMLAHVFSGSYNYITVVQEVRREKCKIESNADVWKLVQAFFREDIGLELPTEWHPDPEREPLARPWGTLMACSTAVFEGDPVSLDEFDAAPLGTWMVGVRSVGLGYPGQDDPYSVCLARKDPRRQVFLRLPYANVREDAKAVARFIMREVAFEKWATANCDRWRLINNMGDISGWIERGGARTDLLRNPDHSFKFPNE